MNQAILYIGILLSGISGTPSSHSLQSGDLLFQVGETSDMTGAITAATGKSRPINFSHVGIVVVTEGADSVLEATTEGGVRLTALNEFLERSAKIDDQPAVIAMRLKDTTGVSAAVHRAHGFLGQPYDYSFRPDDEKFYCSELIWECYQKADGAPLFTARPMNFRAADGTMPQFWIDLFARLGEPIPEGLLGTNPNDMAREECLTELYRFF